MLEGVFRILHVVVEVVGVRKEAVARGKDVGGREVGRGKSEALGFFNLKHLLGVVIKVLTQLITQVGIHIFIPYYAHRLVCTDRTVVGSDDDVVI